MKALQSLRLTCGSLHPVARAHPALRGLPWVQQQRIRFINGLAKPTPSRRIDASTANAQDTTAVLLPPHSLLPTKVLIRSFLVAAISSHPFLLNPALAVLSFLSKQTTWFFNLEKNPILYSIFKNTMYNHFCAGENGREVVATIKGLKDMGYRGVILTYAKEVVIDHSSQEQNDTGGQNIKECQANVSVEAQEVYDPDIEAWRMGVLDTAGLVEENDFLALKFTGAGAAVADSLQADKALPKQMMTALDQICEKAINQKASILIDAEQQFVQKGIDRVAVDLMRKYNRQGRTVVYNTYQAYLKATPDVLYKHLKQAADEGFAIGVKLVRGAYINTEPRHYINDTKQETDVQYDDIACSLLDGKYRDMGHDKSLPMPEFQLFMGTHNKESVLKAYRLQRQRAGQNLPVRPVRYGQLLGMADEVSCTLLQLKEQNRGAPPFVSPEAYKCLSWGTLGDCVSYLMRRAMENKDAVARTKAEYMALRTEMWRRFMKIFS